MTLDNILFDEKSCEKIHKIKVHKISYKTLIDTKSLHIRFDKMDGFIRVYDRTRYVLLVGSGRKDFSCNRIRYFIGVKRNP